MIKMMNASNISDFNATNDSTILSNEELLELKLGPRFQDTWSVVILLTIYGLIFISGTVGNVCTCIVIVRNNYMQTATNYYLFSLAISDVFTLLLALPPEAYSIWEAYPWRFGEVFCYIKALLQEMTSYASVLTIVAFTVERYAAICYPLQAHKFANLSRCIAIIIAIWIISLLCALPYPLHTDTFYYVNNTNGTKIPESLICNMPLEYRSTMIYVFQFSTFAFFVFPMTIIAVLYLLIAIALRKAALQRASSQEAKCQVGTPVSQSGKSVFRMLVAVVVAFFISWAPFHAQRLLTIYIGEWTPLLLDIQSGLFYISGMLYFVGSTVNPILYNVMSKRYREAFRETICHCRKRTSNYRNGSGIHQSYYSHKSIRTTPRTAQTRPDNSRAKNVQRSDTVQTQVNISLNGNSDGLCDSHRELLLRERKQGVPYDSKYWSENSDKSSCCQVCVSEQREIISSPCYERQGLLCNVKSEDSAC